ncbi:MAG TPA: hypothetical protein PKD54_04635, partial [Pirellulaceae bacterium]|nr:hypothetical protein [Pirellulaceae bacterium]
MIERLAIYLTVIGMALVFAGVWSHRGPIWAQDTVVSRAVEDETLLTRRGTILEWRGGEVVIDSVGGPKRIPTARVVEFHTTWQPSYMRARQLIDQRQLLEAAPHLAKAIEEEPRAWARHIIRADLTRCLHLSGQDLTAAQHFIELIDEDSQTRFLWTIPLAWGTTSQDPHLLSAAKSWLGASHPAISLLGASWLLSSPERPAALNVLEELSRDIDPQIAHLASAQIWQTQWVSADARQLERWLTQIERMP